MISLFPKTLPVSEKVKDLLTMLLYISFIIFSTDTMGVVYMVSLICLIYIIHGCTNGLSFPLHFGMFHKYMLWISLFCLLSATWAFNSEYAIEKGITILELLIAFTLLYEVYYNCSISRLLTIIMWSGFFLSVYTILFVGVGNLRDTINEAGRLENSFANVNAIGMCCSISILIVYNSWQKQRNVLDMIMCIPCLLIVAASGSRKAFVMLILGIVLLALFKLGTKKKTKGIRKLFMILFALMILSIVVFFVARSGMFGGTLDRMDGMIASLTGKGDIDSSSMLRAYYREIGFQQFLETPIIGIGMGNARVLALQYSGYDCYLHCNYAEVAACGGLIGLFLVYWIYIKLIRYEIRLYKYDSMAILMLIFLVLNLILDYGKVSYYNKDTYFMIMVFCLHYESVRRRQYSLE